MKQIPLLIVLMLLFVLSACNSDVGAPASDGDLDAEREAAREDEQPLPDGDWDGDFDVEADGEAEAEAEVEAEAEEEAEPVLPLAPEAGHIAIEAIAYRFQDEVSTRELSSTPAKIFYAFQPAEETPEQKPLAVFFNGGPGSSTGLLFGFNTHKYTLDPAYSGQAAMAENAHNWGRFANLLYIDARQTGFSYSEIEHPESKDARSKTFSSANFNSMFDGADFVRVILRFLAVHPQIRANPVILAGESYGGIRATAILHLLQHYAAYADGSRVYQDPALAAEIQTHVDAVFPDLSGQTASPERMAEQFGYQVLIQPLLSGVYQDHVAGMMWEQDGSIIHRIADEEGITYTPCRPLDRDCDPYYNALYFLIEDADRDLYNYTQYYGWMNDLGDAVAEKLVQAEILTGALQVRAEELSGLYAANRAQAFRVLDEADEYEKKRADAALKMDPRSAIHWTLFEKMHPPKSLATRDQSAITTGDLPDTFGALSAWDRFYLPLHRIVNQTFHMNDLLLFDVGPYSSLYGEMFLENLIYSHSFVTNAAYDLIIYGEALPGALALHEDLVQAVDYEREAPDGAVRGGRVTVTYAPNAFGPNTPPSRSFRFPYYPVSCHAVEITEPAELLQDVQAWWEARGN